MVITKQKKLIILALSLLFILVSMIGCQGAPTPEPATARPTATSRPPQELAEQPRATDPPPTEQPTETPTSIPTETPVPTEMPTETPTTEPTPTPTPRPTLSWEISFPDGPSELGDTLIRPADGTVMLYVPGGTFEMGSLPETDQFGPHTVTLDPFWIDQTEVTNAQFAAFLNDQGNRVVEGYAYLEVEQVENAQIELWDDGFKAEAGKEDHPVIEVNWPGVDAYCRWVGGRMPTEAEWEYAARGPEVPIYSWGNDEPTCELAQFGGCGDYSVEVGSFPDGASWVGALDMAGNVWEWTADWYSPYPSEPQVNPIGPESGERKISRGGSYFSAPDTLHTAYRASAPSNNRQPVIGFRCAGSTPMP